MQMRDDACIDVGVSANTLAALQREWGKNQHKGHLSLWRNEFHFHVGNSFPIRPKNFLKTSALLSLLRPFD